mgnify:CR=1 FL=1
MKNEVLISYLQSLFPNYLVKAEFSTNDKDERVIVVQEQPGEKVVFFGDVEPLYSYFQINIYLKTSENRVLFYVIKNKSYLKNII